MLHDALFFIWISFKPFVLLNYLYRLLELSWPEGSYKSTGASKLLENFVKHSSGVGFLRQLGTKEAFQALLSALNDGKYVLSF